ncbi:MAG: TFIIH complex subunit tfb5 [Sclerophora amabilis]|nr:MAG: TFIIH complex subunit tfb5 [Sclerophora amabilis]
MPKASKGVLVECDPSIKAIILKIDSTYHDFIIEDLDDQTLVVKESKLKELKQKLEDELANTQQMPEESGSE